MLDVDLRGGRGIKQLLWLCVPSSSSSILPGLITRFNSGLYFQSRSIAVCFHPPIDHICNRRPGRDDIAERKKPIVRDAYRFREVKEEHAKCPT